MTIAYNPRDRNVELSVVRIAFHGAAGNVIVTGLIVEKYASIAQSGAVHGEDGAAWTLRHN